MRGLYFFPFTVLFIIAFFLTLVFLFIFIQVGLIGYAYERIGISAHLIFPLLLLSLLGSAINIPVTQISGGPVVSQQVVDFFGVRYVIPSIGYREQTVIAVNVGGAVVPTLISLYLLFTTGLFVRGLLGVVLVSAIVRRLAGLGAPVASIGGAGTFDGIFFTGIIAVLLT